MIILSYKPHEINCFSFEGIRMKIMRVVFSVLIFFYCIPIVDKEDGNMKDFCSMELVRDHKCGSEFLSEVITKVRSVLSLLFLKLL